MHGKHFTNMHLSTFCYYNGTFEAAELRRKKGSCWVRSKVKETNVMITFIFSSVSQGGEGYHMVKDRKYLGMNLLWLLFLFLERL